jgi:hypothetical protein
MSSLSGPNDKTDWALFEDDDYENGEDGSDEDAEDKDDGDYADNDWDEPGRDHRDY